jgi:hypothetical protein
MHEILKKYGFIKIHECNCGGLMESWQHPNISAIEVDIRPARHSFTILYGKNVRTATTISGTAAELEKRIVALIAHDQSNDKE